MARHSSSPLFSSSEREKERSTSLQTHSSAVSSGSPLEEISLVRRSIFFVEFRRGKFRRLVAIHVLKSITMSTDPISACGIHRGGVIHKFRPWKINALPVFRSLRFPPLESFLPSMESIENRTRETRGRAPRGRVGCPHHIGITLWFRVIIYNGKFKREEDPLVDPRRIPIYRRFPRFA